MWLLVGGILLLLLPGCLLLLLAPCESPCDLDTHALH